MADVDSSAKQIQILLSDEVGFSAQRIRKVSMRNMVADLVQAAASEAQRRNIRVEHTVNQHVRDVKAAPDQFLVALSNLLQNGINLMAKGA